MAQNVTMHTVKDTHKCPILSCVLSEQTEAVEEGQGQLQPFILRAHIIKESSKGWWCAHTHTHTHQTVPLPLSLSLFKHLNPLHHHWFASTHFLVHQRKKNPQIESDCQLRPALILIQLVLCNRCKLPNLYIKKNSKFWISCPIKLWLSKCLWTLESHP